MRVLYIVPLLFLLAGDASAQASSSMSEAPGVVVTQIGWHKEANIPALHEDPMRVHDEQSDLVGEQKATVRGNAVRIQQGEPPKPLPTRMPSGENAPLGLTANYHYEAKIKNTGEKTIRGIVWEYLLFDPETEVEVGHHRYTSKVSVRAGKTADLVGRSTKPPTSVVDVTKSGKEWRGKYSERVLIIRIDYNDGSFWQRPLNEP